MHEATSIPVCGGKSRKVNMACQQLVNSILTSSSI